MAGKQNPPKKHHFVPQFYLREFTSIKGRLQVFDKKSGKHFTALPKDVAFRRHFHSASNDTKGQFEITFSKHIESPLAKEHQKILENLRVKKFLPIELRDALNWLAVYQMLRVPITRKRLREIIPEFTENQDLATLDEMTVRHHLRMLEPTKDGVVRRIVEQMESFDISFLRTDANNPFWTSDDPFLIVHEDLWTKRARSGRGLGLASLKAQVFFPLASDIVAVFHRKNLPLPINHVKMANLNLVHWVNERTLANAQSQTYSSTVLRIHNSWLRRLKEMKTSHIE